MLKTGYTKQWREILDWEWYHDHIAYKLFNHLIMTANIKDSKWCGKLIKRGSRVVTYEGLSKETFISVQQIRTYFKKLSSTGELTIKTTNKYTVVTVNNYDYYQGETDIPTNKQQTKMADLNEYSMNKVKKTTNSTRTSTNKNNSQMPINTNKNEYLFTNSTQTLTNNQQSNNNQSTINQHYNKNNKEYNKEYSKEERGSETLPNAIPTPTLSEVVDFTFENNLRVNPNKFYYYYENKGWNGIKNWKMKLMEWNETERPTQINNTPTNKPLNDSYSFDLDAYEMQLRTVPSLD